MKARSVVIASVLLAACETSGPGGPLPPPPPPPPPAGPPGDVGFNITDLAFVDTQGRRNDQASVTMTAGQVVGWLHDGLVAHTVTFDEIPAAALTSNSGDLGNGQRFAQTLTVPGTYKFHCDNHPQVMAGATIIVN